MPRALLASRNLIGEDFAAFKQPFWSEGVYYVFGTFCKGSLGTVQM